MAGDIALAVLQSASRLKDDRAFFGYFWAIAANTYKKYLRKKNRIFYGELEEDAAAFANFGMVSVPQEEGAIAMYVHQYTKAKESGKLVVGYDY